MDIKDQVQKRFSKGPNGTNFVGTILYTCLLSTAGFHVLSRTGHTDLTEAFWFHHLPILHTTNHLKYQELSIFYAFLRGKIPNMVVETLHSEKPGI